MNFNSLKIIIIWISDFLRSYTSQVVEIFLKICELRNIGALVLLVVIPQVLVASLVLGWIRGLDNVHYQPSTFLQAFLSLNTNIGHTVNLFLEADWGLESEGYEGYDGGRLETRD